MSIDAAIIQHVDRSAPITHAVADQVLNAISPSLVVNVSLSVSETGSASESPSVESEASLSATETGSASESASVQAEASLSAAEAGAASEAPSVGGVATPSINETGAATEAPSVITNASLSVSESIINRPLLLDTYPGAVAGYQLGSADLLSRNGGAVAAYILHS